MFLFSFNPALRTAVAAVAVFAISSNALAQKKYDPGASDTEIKIGNFVPYSGPVSAYGTIGKAAGAYFDKINDEGGVSGRKIKYISVDDEYNPAKSVAGPPTLRNPRRPSRRRHRCAANRAGRAAPMPVGRRSDCLWRWIADPGTLHTSARIAPWRMLTGTDSTCG